MTDVTVNTYQIHTLMNIKPSASSATHERSSTARQANFKPPESLPICHFHILRHPLEVNRMVVQNEQGRDQQVRYEVAGFQGSRPARNLGKLAQRI